MKKTDQKMKKVTIFENKTILVIYLPKVRIKMCKKMVAVDIIILVSSISIFFTCF